MYIAWCFLGHKLWYLCFCSRWFSPFIYHIRDCTICLSTFCQSAINKMKCEFLIFHILLFSDALSISDWLIAKLGITILSHKILELGKSPKRFKAKYVSYTGDDYGPIGVDYPNLSSYFRSLGINFWSYFVSDVTDGPMDRLMGSWCWRGT